MNHFREIAYLSGIARPDVAVIVNIGTMHIEHLGSMEGILQAKLEILEGMDDDGKIILNGDDSLLWNLHTTHPNATFFGVKNTNCSVLGKDVESASELLRFRVRYKTHEFPVDLAVEGEHYIPDALAAISVGLELGVDPDKISYALSHFQNTEGRQEIFTAGEYTIIKDCYNAGPESMAAALSVLHNRPGRHVAVLGDMLELGACTQAEHYKVGRIAAEKADVLLAFGPNSSRMLKGAITGGMSDTQARAFTDRDQLLNALTQMVRPGDVILFKGSRGMQMEQISDRFIQQDK